MNLRLASTALFALCMSGSSGDLSAPGLQQDRGSQAFLLEAGEHHLKDVLNRAAAFLKRNYLMTASEMDQVTLIVHLQNKLVLDASGCEEVVSQLAYRKGFAIVPMDAARGIYEVISMRGSRRSEIATHALHLSPEEVLRKSKLKANVLTTVPLKHIDAARAAQQLRPFFASGGGGNGIQFGNAGGSRSILLQGYADQVAAVIRMLRTLDVPGTARNVALTDRLTRVETRLRKLEARGKGKKK